MKLGRMTSRLERMLPTPPQAEPEATGLFEELMAFKTSGPLGQPAKGPNHLQRWATEARLAATTTEARSLGEATGAAVHPTPYGTALVIDTLFPVTSNHGGRRVGGLFEQASPSFSELRSLMDDVRLEGFDPRRTIFLDIEASGLQHGAGTYAFLIGLGYLDDAGDNFVVRQLLLEELASEQAVLHLLVEHLDRYDYLASFNGKSYDLTVLISRLVMHRFYTQRDCDLKLRPHFDLLHLSRNLYKDCWSDTKLQTLERQALGFERVDDVPGSLVPSCWYHYLRTGDPRPVSEVVSHNLYDVVSMVTLADRLVADVVEQGAYESRTEQPSVLVNLGVLLLRRHRPEEALGCFMRALDQLERGDRFVARALPKAVVAARRAGETDLQGALIERWCDHYPESPEAWTAAAIYQERVRKELAVALVAAYRAQALAPSEATQRRIERLRGRIEKARRRTRRAS